MDKVVVFADHNIGYELVEYLYNNQSDYKIVKIYTNQNSQSWWNRIEDNKNVAHILEFYDSQKTPSQLQFMEVDYLLLLSWKHIIPETLINSIRKKVINLHYSLLPNHRGVYPINNAIMNGDEVTGVTYHIVNTEIDSGDIIAQEKTHIQWTDDSYTLLNKLDTIALNLFTKIWPERNKWNTYLTKQENPLTYNSRKKFELSNLISMQKQYQAVDFVNLLRSKTFNGKTSAYFIDEKSGEKFSITIKINKLDE